MNVSADRYHHGDLRDTLMERACAHIAEAGIEKLSLRALAREAGVSATAPYRHFPTRRCLLAALATQGFNELTEVVERAAEPHRTHSDRAVFAAGMAYIGYAQAEPVKYHLMFGGGIGDFSSYAMLRDAADASYMMIENMVAEAVAEGVFVDDVPRLMMVSIWSAVHGISSLLIDKPVPATDATAPQAPQALTALGHLRRSPQAALLRLTRGLVSSSHIEGLEAFVAEHWPH